jgi:hypothetical protein
MPSLSLPPRERSAVIRDSFFVLPASFDRTIRVLLSVDGDRGFSDRDTLTLFVPRIVATGVEDAPQADGFDIEALYPNPLRGGTAMLNVRVRSFAPYRWEVVDLLGRSVRRSSVAVQPSHGKAGGVLRIDCADLPQGRYLLRVLSAEGAQTRGFVILN